MLRIARYESQGIWADHNLWNSACVFWTIQGIVRTSEKCHRTLNGKLYRMQRLRGLILDRCFL
jgi:hypothetical protein